MVWNAAMQQQSDEEEWEAALESLETAALHIKNAIKHLRLDGAVSGTVEGYMQDAVLELGGQWPVTEASQ